MDINTRTWSLDPVEEAAESQQVGVLAARGFAASRRITLGGTLDETDRSALLNVADLLDTSGRVVEYFTSHGESGQAPSEAVASKLDVTIDAVVDSHPTGASLQEAVTTIAAIVRNFVSSPSPQVAEELAPFFSLLSRAAARRTAVPGETVVAV